MSKPFDNRSGIFGIRPEGSPILAARSHRRQIRCGNRGRSPVVRTEPCCLSIGRKRRTSLFRVVLRRLEPCFGRSVVSQRSGIVRGFSRDGRPFSCAVADTGIPILCRSPFGPHLLDGLCPGRRFCRGRDVQRSLVFAALQAEKRLRKTFCRFGERIPVFRKEAEFGAGISRIS